MKYFIYCRKSSEEETKQVQSLDTQQRILLDYASRMDLDIVDIIKEAKSARTDENRPLFTQMLQRISKGEADGILVVHTDRLTRNLIEAGYINKLVEAGLLKAIKTPNNTYDTLQSLLYLGFEFLFATQYSRDLSAKVKQGNESKLLNGEYPARAPIGYINITPGKGIKPDPIRAPFIKRAFELFLTREYSVKSLAKKLHEEGFRSQYGKRKTKTGIYWILTNPEYYGVIRRKCILYKGKHKPLITKKMFDDVQDILNNRCRPKKQKHDFTYRDFLTCAECGCKMTAGIAKGKYIYYRCTNGKGNCDQHKRYWSSKHIEKQFQQFFDKFTLDPERAEKSFQLYKKQKLSETQTQEIQDSAIQEQIKQLTIKQERLEDMYLDGRISPERYDERRSNLQSEKAQLQVLLANKKTKDLNETLELVEEIKNQAIRLSEIFICGDRSVQRDLLKSVLWNSEFKDGEITATRLNKLWQGCENLNNCHDLDVWRRVQDSNL